MRFDDLFDDLESQLEHELGVEDVELAAEEERLRLGRLSFRSRLTSLSAESRGGFTVVVHLVTGRSLTVRPSDFGKDWLHAVIVDERPRPAECILPLASLAALSLARDQVSASLGGEQATSADRLVEKIGLPFVLRDLCRRRRAVTLDTRTGLVTGTIDRVGRDHLDLAVHEAGSERRRREVTDLRVVPFSELILVRL